MWVPLLLRATNKLEQIHAFPWGTGSLKGLLVFLLESRMFYFIYLLIFHGAGDLTQAFMHVKANTFLNYICSPGQNILEFKIEVYFKDLFILSIPTGCKSRECQYEVRSVY